jgi:hypothetical protein
MWKRNHAAASQEAPWIATTTTISTTAAQRPSSVYLTRVTAAAHAERNAMAASQHACPVQLPMLLAHIALTPRSVVYPQVTSAC